ncbi:MAG: ABC transporter permease [Oscillospiraceae bacterium]|jgi:spermidine/putrescine transport system permease protein|nr:ABC transporter permease [Oscillospiraceae bacterium]
MKNKSSQPPAKCLRNRKQRATTFLFTAPYIIWMCVFILIPLGVVFFYAMTDANTGLFTFANLSKVFSPAFMKIFGRSIWYSLLASAICLVIGYPVAYFIARQKPSVQRTLYLLVMLPMCMSFLLRTLAWVGLLQDTGIINRFLGLFGIGPLHLIRNTGAVILGMVYNYLPYMIMPLYTVIMKIDPLLIEAAEDLGCNSRRTFQKVIFPLSIPGIVSGVTMVFVPAVSTFYISQKLGSTSTTMIGDVIESQFKTAYNPNLGAALSLVLMVLIFVCVGIMNRFAGSDTEGQVVV